jgi:hypothetical protein
VLPTARVARWWAGREDATLAEPTSSHANCLKTRRFSPAACTLVGRFLLEQVGDHLTMYKDIHTKLIETYIVKVRISEELPTAPFFHTARSRHVYIYFGYPVWATAERLIME